MAEVGHRPRLDDDPGAHDAEAVAQRLDLRQDVARQQDRATSIASSSRQRRKTASINGSSPDVGSSSTNSSASDASAATSATFWRLPLE